MGRQVRRVPIDFDWPIGEIWKGFLNPYSNKSIKCDACDGTGSSLVSRWLSDLWYGNRDFDPAINGSPLLTVDTPAVRKFAERNVSNFFPRSHFPEFCENSEIAIIREAMRLIDMWNRQWCHHLHQRDVDALVAAGRLMDFTHTWAPETGWKPKDPPYIPTAKEVNEWSLSGFGHDSINQWVVVRAECERRGIETRCSVCDGEGFKWPDSETQKNHDEWEQEEPPTGEGWQLWETVSEGSPITPVFKTPEELIDFMCQPSLRPGLAWEHGYSRKGATAMVMGDGWAPSMVMSGGQIMNGVDGLAALDKKDEGA